MASIRKVRLPLAGFHELATEASAEGFTFLEPVEDDWRSGQICFDGPGEAFYGVYEADALEDDSAAQRRGRDTLVGVGAVSRDPFLDAGDVGRLRRIFVRAPWRGKGIGAELVATMLADARRSFKAVRLRAESARAARLYERFGFMPINDPNATHLLLL